MYVANSDHTVTPHSLISLHRLGAKDQIFLQANTPICLFVCVEVLRPVNPMGSCPARSVYFLFLDRLSSLSTLIRLFQCLCASAGMSIITGCMK